MSRRDPIRFIALLGGSGFLVGATAMICSAQAVQEPTIRVETREVVLPVEVVEERKDPKGMLTGPNGEVLYIYIVHSDEIRGLSAKAFHIFEDGVEQRIQHFSIETTPGWLVRDNVAQHVEYSWTPKGIWGGSDKKKIEVDESRRFHKYLLTYVPPSSPKGTCHRIALKVDRRHATIFAPDQYCNTKDPLSDPLYGTDLGNRLLEYENSPQTGTLSLVVQLSPFSGSSGTYHVNISAEIPASLLKRKWEGNHLHTSTAILGLVYDKSHALVARFSDTACLAPECNSGYEGPLPPNESNIPPPISAARKYWEDVTMPTSYQTQLDFSPGDYRLELVLTDGENFGRATAFFTVNDFSRDSLGIGGIALCKRYRRVSADARAPTQAPQYIPLVSDDTEFTPAGDTRFHKGEPFISFFEIYGTQIEQAAATMHLEVRVTDTKTGEIKSDTGSQPLKLSTSPKHHSAPIVRRVSIDALSPGSYRLEAQVSDSEGHKTEWRAASFTVD